MSVVAQTGGGRLVRHRLREPLLYRWFVPARRAALNNAAKHSRASAIQGRLWQEDGLVRLMIQDDGSGFDLTLVDREAHFGLQLIAERVASVGGHVVVESKSGSGTLIVAALPPNL